MNVWYMHPYAGSPNVGMSFRPYFIARELNKLKVKTVVISSSYHHLSQFSDGEKGLNTFEDVEFYLVETNEYQGNGISRIRNMLSYGLNLFGSKFRKFSSEFTPDVIIVSTAHPFHIFAAKYYAKKYNAKLILEVRDVWPLSLVEVAGVKESHPFTKLVELVQNFAYRNCDHCVSLLANAEHFFVSKGLKENSFTYIPNGIIEQKENTHSSLCSKIERDLSGFEFSIGYTGAIGVPNNLMPLIEAAKKLEDHNVAICLVGDGVCKKEILDYIEKHSINNVFIYGSVSKKEIPSIIAMFSIMFINSKPQNIYKLGISPNKIFDYMLEDKCVLNGIDAPNNPLQELGCEIFFDTKSSDDLVEKVLSFKESPYEVSTKSEVLRKYHYSSLARKYKAVMESV